MYIFEYFQTDTFNQLPKDRITQSYAVAFHGDKIVIVHNGIKNTWGLVGGTIEKGETPEQTLIREVREESNMKVLKFTPIGYQKVWREDTPENYFFQLRFCAMVEPHGLFVSDPDGTIDRIAEINPADHKKYFDWGEIGEAIIERAIELIKNLK